VLGVRTMVGSLTGGDHHIWFARHPKAAPWL